MTQRVAIVGAGAIGGYFAAGMIAAGHDVTLIDPWPENVRAIAAGGLTISGMAMDAPLRVPARILDLGQVQGLIRAQPFDHAFIALKAYDTLWAVQMILPWLQPGGAVVSLQNGFEEPRIATVAGAARTWGCAIAALACAMEAPGHVRRLAPSGHVMLGALDPSAADPAAGAGLQSLLQSVEKTTLVDDLAAAKWSKLVINAMRNALSAMTGLSGRARDADPLTRAVSIQLGAETVLVGRAMGLQLVDTLVSFDALVAAAAGDRAAEAEIAARLAEVAAARSAEQRPSMGQDIAKGRRTEIDALNGLVVQRGHALGVATPANAAICKVVHRIERGEVAPDPALARMIPGPAVP